MAIRSVTISLPADPDKDWNVIETVYAEVGDEVRATVYGAGSQYHWGEVAIADGDHYPDGTPAFNDHGTIWSYTVVAADQQASGYYRDAEFFSPYIHEDGVAATHRGILRINVPNPIFTGVTHDNAAAANVTVTLALTATHATKSGTYPALQYRQSGGSFGNSNTILQERGTTKNYDTRLWTAGPVTFGGVSSAGAGDEYYQRQLSLDYLPTHLAIDTPSDISTNTGEWVQTISGIVGTYNNYTIANADDSSAIQLYKKNNTDSLSTTVNGTTITNDEPENNAPGTTTHYIWASRTSTSGGNGGQGWPTSWEYTGKSFDVTYTQVFDATCTDPTGTYWDIDLTDTGSEFSVNFAGLSSGKFYKIFTSSTSTASSGMVWVGWNTDVFWSTYSTKEVICDNRNASGVTGTNTTDTTYYLWRSDTYSGTYTYADVSFTRTLMHPDRIEADDVGVPANQSTYTVTIDNTISGHEYFIHGTNSSTASVLGSATATGTSLEITVSSSLPGANAGESTVHYVWHRSPVNKYATVKQSTGAQYTVTRTGTGTGSGASEWHDYGMRIRRSNGQTITDTRSRLGKVVQSGTIPTSGYLTHNPSYVDVTVTGMENNAYWNVIVVPDSGGSAWSPSGYQFSVVKSSGSFRLTNQQSFGQNNRYKYWVVKSGTTS